MVISKKNIIFQGFRGVPTFTRGGGGGGGGGGWELTNDPPRASRIDITLPPG